MSPSAPRPASRDCLADRACFIAAFVVTLGWFFAYEYFRPDYLVDEAGHIGNVIHFLEGKPGWPEQMTMLPGYHFIVAAFWQLHPPLKLLTLARLVSTVMSCVGLLAFACAWRRLHLRDVTAPIVRAGRATLLVALLPLLQPFTGMAYTDAPALTAVLVAFLAQLAGRYALAALLFAVAGCFRQTNLLWAAFVIPWEWTQLRDSVHAAGTPIREFVRRTQWLWGLLVVAAALVIAAGRVSVGTQTGTEPRPNIATLHCAGAIALLLGLPSLLAHAPAAFRRAREAARTHRARAAIVVLSCAAIVVLSLTYSNSHPWNRELFWTGNTFTLLRNWPLVWIEQHPWLRVASSVNLVVISAATIAVFAGQPRRTALWLAFAAGALLPLANNLVEPRYFIPGAVFALLFLEMDRSATTRLTIWWTLLCLVHAPFVARGLSLW